MSNFIFNSARKLFAAGLIDWNYVTGVSTNRGYTGANLAFADYKIKAALVNTTGGNIATYSSTGFDTSAVVYSQASNTGNMKSIFGWDAGTPWSTSSLIRSGTGGSIITAELINRALVSTSGAADSDDITFAAVATTFGVAGAQTFGPIEGMVIYLENLTTPVGDGSDFPVIAFIDTLSGPTAMSITPNGGDIVVQWSASGIFRL